MCKYYIFRTLQAQELWSHPIWATNPPQNLPFEKNPSKTYHMLAHSLKSIHNSFKINKVQMIKL